MSERDPSKSGTEDKSQLLKGQGEAPSEPGTVRSPTGPKKEVDNEDRSLLQSVKSVKSVVSNSESGLNSLTLPYGNRFSGHSERRIKIADWGTAEVSLTTPDCNRG